MNNCKMCGTTIPEGTNECPNCKFKINSSKNVDGFQKNVKKGIKGYLIYIIGSIVIALLVFICIIVFGVGMFKEINKTKNEINKTKNEINKTKTNSKD